MPDIDKALLEKCARALLEDERKHGGCPAALDMQAHIVLEASGLLAENAALKARVAELEELLDRLCIHLTEIHPMLPRSNHDRYASGEIPVRIWLEVASATGQLDWAVRYLQNNNPDALAEWRCGNDECTLNITNDPWPCSTCEKNNGGDCECNRLSHWRGREMGRFRADLANAQQQAAMLTAERDAWKAMERFIVDAEHIYEAYESEAEDRPNELWVFRQVRQALAAYASAKDGEAK